MDTKQQLKISFKKIFKQLILIRQKLFLFLLNILIGIFCGSIFGTFLPIFRSIFPWDILIIGLIIIISEFINILIYTKKNNSTNKIFFIEYINWLKIGILLGLFIDAFKVGS
jgi:uncharacterized membrane protein